MLLGTQPVARLGSQGGAELELKQNNCAAAHARPACVLLVFVSCKSFGSSGHFSVDVAAILGCSSGSRRGKRDVNMSSHAAHCRPFPFTGIVLEKKKTMEHR